MRENRAHVFASGHCLESYTLMQHPNLASELFCLIQEEVILALDGPVLLTVDRPRE